MRQLGMFQDTHGDLKVDRVNGVHVRPRDATEEEVVAWLRSKGWRGLRKGKPPRKTPIEPHRLSAQCRTILRLIQAGGDFGAWNTDLAHQVPKYTARITELRALGYRIEIIEESGRYRRRYALV